MPVMFRSIKLLFILLAPIILFSCKPLTLTGAYDGKYKDFEFRIDNNLQNSVYLPKSPNGGAILFLPSCTGVQGWNFRDIKKYWLNPLLKSGFVVGVVDYNANRNARRPWNCGKNKHLSGHRLVRDVFNGVQALAAVPGVEKDKIFTIGTSLGAQIGAEAISRKYTKVAQKENLITPRAHIGLYGGCSYPSRTYLTANITSPVLWLSGGRDVEVGDGCNDFLFNRITRSQPDSKFVLYKNATHCWDCSQLNGHSKQTAYGMQTYIFDAAITKSSQAETLKFIRNLMK